MGYSVDEVMQESAEADREAESYGLTPAQIGSLDTRLRKCISALVSCYSGHQRRHPRKVSHEGDYPYTSTIQAIRSALQSPYVSCNTRDATLPSFPLNYECISPIVNEIAGLFSAHEDMLKKIGITGPLSERQREGIRKLTRRVTPLLFNQCFEFDPYVKREDFNFLFDQRTLVISKPFS